MASSPQDYATILEMVANKGVNNGNRVISEQAINWLLDLDNNEGKDLWGGSWEYFGGGTILPEDVRL